LTAAVLAGAAGATPTPAAADTTTVFVQFEAQRLVAGPADDAPNDVSWTLEWFGVTEFNVPAFAVGPTQNRDQVIAATLQEAEQQWEQVDVRFVTERPTSGDYLMVTMGGEGRDIGLRGAGGWGIVDCYDDNKTAVAFVFSEVLANDEGDMNPGTELPDDARLGDPSRWFACSPTHLCKGSFMFLQ
jgi:hypothetical protein